MTFDHGCECAASGGFEWPSPRKRVASSMAEGGEDQRLRKLRRQSRRRAMMGSERRVEEAQIPDLEALTVPRPPPWDARASDGHPQVNY